jgi:hypothetical protein
MASIIIDKDHIIGLPPSGYVSSDIIKNSMPIAEITPQNPEARFGTNIFTVVSAMSTYKGYLKELGYGLSGNTLKLAFLADNFPTDTFNNEYGELFLQRLTNVGSQAAQEISQIFNIRNFKFSNLTSPLQNVPFMGSMVKQMENLSQFGTNKLKDASPRVSKTVQQMGSMAKQVLTGARLDFPQLWRNSTFAPSYTMTIRLFNPNPKSLESTKKYIIGPIGAILLLALPVSEDGSSYKWPFLHIVKAKGIYNLNPAFISGISIVKGGDQQNIAWNQHMGVVDIRIDFGSLYNSILVDKNNKISPGRPTLNTYLKAFESDMDPGDTSTTPSTITVTELPENISEIPDTTVKTPGVVRPITFPRTLVPEVKKKSFLNNISDIVKDYVEEEAKNQIQLVSGQFTAEAEETIGEIKDSVDNRIIMIVTISII